MAPSERKPVSNEVTYILTILTDGLGRQISFERLVATGGLTSGAGETYTGNSHGHTINIGVVNEPC